MRYYNYQSVIYISEHRQGMSRNREFVVSIQVENIAHTLSDHLPFDTI